MTPQEIDRETIATRRDIERALLTEISSPRVTGELPLAFALAAINAAIWERENLMRRLAKVPDALMEIGQLAVETHRLNDWRAELLGEEKIRR
jgi:hypothetical protein